jgi:diphthamide biosynthesis methyltransferase
MTAARSQKKIQLQDFYTKCLAKKKSNHLKARTQQQHHQKTSREETRRKNQQMLSQANKIKISL